MNINEVVKWLENEIEHNRPIVDGIEDMTDGSEPIYEGRSELAEQLLTFIRNHYE